MIYLSLRGVLLGIVWKIYQHFIRNSIFSFRFACVQCFQSAIEFLFGKGAADVFFGFFAVVTLLLQFSVCESFYFPYSIILPGACLKSAFLGVGFDKDVCLFPVIKDSVIIFAHGWAFAGPTLAIHAFYDVPDFPAVGANAEGVDNFLPAFAFLFHNNFPSFFGYAVPLFFLAGVFLSFFPAFLSFFDRLLTSFIPPGFAMVNLFARDMSLSSFGDNLSLRQ